VVCFLRDLLSNIHSEGDLTPPVTSADEDEDPDSRPTKPSPKKHQRDSPERSKSKAKSKKRKTNSPSSTEGEPQPKRPKIHPLVPRIEQATDIFLLHDAIWYVFTCEISSK
jgi:hypothetical protein